MFLYIFSPTISITFDLNIIIFITMTILITIALVLAEKNRIIKEKSKRIKALKEIADNIHKNFSVTNIKETSVQNIGTVLEADRCLIAEYDPSSKKFGKVTTEYLSSPEKVISLKGDLPSVQATRVTNVCINNKILNIYNTKKYISENELQDTLIDEFYTKYNIKSVLAIPIRHSGKVLGAIILHYTKKNMKFSGEDIQFVTGIADSIGVAIYQSNLFEEEKIVARRDSILRHIIATIRSSIDKDEIKQSIVKEIGKAFNADRCYLRAFDQLNDCFLKPDVEYLASPNIKSLMDITPDQEGLRYFFKQVKNKDFNAPIQVTEHSMLDENIKNSALERYFKQANIKSDFAMPIWNKKNKLTFLVLHFAERTSLLSEEDKYLLMELSKQISIVLDQSDLYDEAKIQAERERTTRKIVDIIRGSLELNDILTSVAKELLNYFDGVQRVFVGSINFKAREHFIEITSNSETKTFSESDGSTFDLVADYWEIYLLAYKTKRIIPNIKESDLPSDVRQAYIDLNVKSIIALPIKSKEEIWGGVFLSSIDKYKQWSKDEVAFLESIIDQLDTAITQAELFETQKKTAEREALLRKVIETIRSSIDIDEILTTICDEVAKIFKVQRATIIEFSDKKDLSNWKTRREYKERDDIKGLKDIAYDNRVGAYNGQSVMIEGKNLVIDNLVESNTPDYYKKTYNELGVKAILSVPIKGGEDKFGIIFLSSIDDYRHWTKEEVQLLESIAAQVYVAIKQAELFETQKKTAEREALLRKVIETIRSSIDIDEILTTICDEVAKIFKVQRATIIEHPDKNDLYCWKIRREYKERDDIKGFKDVPFDNRVGIYTSQTVMIKGINLVIDNLEESDTPDYYKNTYSKLGVKAILSVPIKSGEDKFGIIFLSSVDYYRHWTKEEVQLLESIAAQVYVAIKQAELFEAQTKVAKREKMSRELVNMIRQSLDINKIIHTFVFEIGKLLEAKRSFFSKYDEKTSSFLTPRDGEEYLASTDMLSYRNLGRDFEYSFSFISNALKTEKKTIVISDIHDFIKKHHLQDTVKKKHLPLEHLFSSVIIPILYKDKLLGGYVFDCDLRKKLEEKDISFLETIAEQTAIAINQAELLEKERLSSQREIILRKIIETIRSSINLEFIKQEMVIKIGEFFKADRVSFADYDFKKQTYITLPDNEYLSSTEVKTFVGYDFLVFPEFFKEIISTHIKGNDIIFSDLDKYLEETNLKGTKIENFYREMGFMSSMAINTYHGDLFYGNIIIAFNEKREISEEDIKFVKTLADQAGIAIYQADLYQKEKEAAERERFIRETTAKCVSTFDLSQIKQIVNDIGIITKADRCYIVEVDIEKLNGKPVSTNEEYLSSEDIISIVGYNFPTQDVKEFVEIFLSKKDLMFFDYEKIKNTPEIHYTRVKAYSNTFNLKSGVGIPFFYQDKLTAVLTIEYVQSKFIPSDNDLNFLRIIGHQVGIAFNQAKLYQKEKQVAQREKTLRELVNMIRQSIEIKEIITSFISETGELFDFQRAFFSKYDKEKNILYTPDEHAGYTKSPAERSYKDLGEDFSEAYGLFQKILCDDRKKVFIQDREQFIKEYGLEDTPEAKNLRLDDIGSLICIPIIYEDILLGVYAASHKQTYAMTPEIVRYLEAITEQIAIALYQAELLVKEKEALEREQALRRIINIVRSSFNINEIKKEFVMEVGKYFGANRCFIYEIGPNIKSGIYIEYTSSPEIKRMSEDDFSKPQFKYWEKAMFQKEIKNSSLIPDLQKYVREHNLENTPVNGHRKEYNIKTAFGIPIIYAEKIYGELIIQYTEEVKTLNASDENFLEVLANQAGIAINQAELLEKEKQALERERILREIVTAAKSTLDIKKVKTVLVNKIGALLNADICLLVEYDEAINNFLPLDEFSEYRSSPEISSQIGYDFGGKDVKSFSEIHRKLKILYTEDMEEYIKKNNLEGTREEKYLKMTGAKSAISISIFYQNLLVGVLTLYFVKEKRSLTPEDINFLTDITIQAGSAIYQSRLFDTIKNQASRELVLKEITEEIRSHLDIRQRKKAIVDSIGKSFGADRCLIIENSAIDDNLPILDEYSEYLSSPEIKSYIGFDFGKEGNVPHFKKTHQKFKEIFIENSEEFIKKHHLHKTADAQFLIESETKSAFGLSLYYEKTFLGVLALNYVNSVKVMSEEDKNLLRILSIQVANALHQSQMYESQRKTAYKESVLKEIISAIKLTRDLQHAYYTLLHKLADIFNLNRTLFLESSLINPDELDIKYEYVIDRKDMSVNNLVFPQVCIDEFLNLIRNLNPLILDDVSRCYPEQTSDFFQKYKIQALMSVPLVKYNGEAKVLGFIVLCSEETRKWTEEEIKLIQIISDSVVSVIWEITKFLETEELRNTFVLTLAHDFQVPLVGERTALDYLLNYSDCSFGKNKEILQELLENNQSITTLLSKSVNIYNYESGKKTLNLEVIKVAKILNEATILAQNDANLKKIKINFKKSEVDYWIRVDKKEIMNVLSILLENAIQHSPEGNEVKIEYYQKSNRIIISINNMGKPMPKEIQEKIFKRYEMAHAIERKIGAGTGLFLSKRIIEAHKGAIWFDTNKTNGTTFYLSLPVINRKEDLL